MSWLMLIIAGFCELGFIAWLQQAMATGRWYYRLLSVFSVTLSMILLSQATKTIPLSVAYAVWTGIGAISSVLYGIFRLNEKSSPAKFFFVGCILVGVIGLKMAG
ncbi:DMT family transporter [Loigolactobacillus iwatensis]|uniref:DMT family transporter n=1 Tax=Loigolactobacillus iwatensis TaxID=1267156 RepID=UPI000F7E8697|nr:multidrug efflux SMR transporter [Loigolactobacillus iwatensis]